MAQMSGALDKQTRLVINHITKKQEIIPAIDRIHTVERGCVTYTPPLISVLSPDSPDHQASLDEYLERLELCFLDLKWLLSLNYQKFWCQIIYDTTCQGLIDSYLKLAPRPHDILKLENLTRIVTKLQSQIHKSVFLVCLRMSTFKENSNDFMNAEAFADIVYNYFLFDIPKIFDLCVLYKKNPVLVKMIDNLFKSQSSYFNDFKICIKDILSAFEKSKQNLRKLFDLDSIYYTPEILKEKKVSVYTTVKDNLTAIIELIYYLTDFSITISDLTSVQPELFKYLSDQKFEYHIKDLMEHTIFPVEDVLKKMNLNLTDSDNQTISSLIMVKLKTLKFQQTKLFKEVIESNSIKPLISNLDNPVFSQDQIKVQEQECVNYFVQVCCDIMEEKRFLCYYEEKFSMSEQINLVQQLTESKIDEMTRRFLVENLKSCVKLYSRKKSVRARFDAKSSSFVNKSVDKYVATASMVGNDEIDNLIQSVLDLLPGTDKGLIKKCLVYYNQNVEQVINAFLENNLPEFPSQEIETAPTDSSGYTEIKDNDYVTSKITRIMSELDLRKSVYDGDEFDIFKKSKVDMSKVYLGKKGDIERFDLDKREGINRDFYKNYDHIMYERECKELGLDPVKNEQAEYEDEYDDTYDAVTNANDEVEPESLIRPLNKKLGIKKRDQFEEDEEGEEGRDCQEQEAYQKNTAIRNQTMPQSQQRQQQSGNQYRSGYSSSNNSQTFQFSRGQNIQKNQQLSQQRPLPQRNSKSKTQQNYGGQQHNRDIYQDQQQSSQLNKYQQKDSGLELKDSSQNRNSQLVNLQNSAKPQFTEGFQNKYGKPSSASSLTTIENNKQREIIDRDNNQEESAKTAEQIKRERKLKNDNKNKHRKDLAARKGNLL